MKAKLGLVVAELHETGVGLIGVGLIMVRLMVVRLDTMRLGKKFKNRLSPKICLSWTFLPLELS